MNIIYKVISINEQSHTFVVRFYTDIVTEESLAVSVMDGVILRDKDNHPLRCSTDCNLTLYKPELSDEQIHQYIIASAPIETLKFKENLIKGNIKDTIERVEHLLNKEIKFEHKIKQELTQIEIDKLLEDLTK